MRKYYGVLRDNGRYLSGHHLRVPLPEGFQRDGLEIHGGVIEAADEYPPRRCDHKRYCQECGKEVCSYKDADMERVWCYAHDHLTPWTRPYIMGSYDHKKRHSLERRNFGNRGNHRGIMKGVASG